MNNRKNPFAGRTAVPLWEFRASKQRWQMKIFWDKLEHDANFDWPLRIKGYRPVRVGTPWRAEWTATHSSVELYVMLTEEGEPLYLRPCVTFGNFVQVVPVRRNCGLLEIGVVLQNRPFAATAEHPDCSIMAGLVRGFTNKGELEVEAATREIKEEMCCPVESITFFGRFNPDSSYVSTHGFLFVAFVGNCDPSLELDAEERIAVIRWYTLHQLLSRIGDVSVEDFGDKGGRKKVNFGGAIDFCGLLFALPRAQYLRTAMAEALTTK